MVVEYGKMGENVEEELSENPENGGNSSVNGEASAKVCSFKSILGVILAILSGILFTANNFIINQFQVVVSDAVLVRCIIVISIYTLIIYSSGDKILPQNQKKKLFTLAQGLAGAINFITSLASVSFMPVPDALCIIFACPIVTMVLSVIILGDKLNVLKCISGILLLLGVVLVCQPPFLFHQLQDGVVHDNLYYIGVSLAVTACCTGGLLDVLVARCEGVSTPVLVNWSAILGLGIAVLYSQLQSASSVLSADIVKIGWADWLILIGLAVSGLLAFTSRTQAIKFIAPNLVTSLRTLELVLAFGVQSLITGESPALLPCIGGGLILGGILLLTFQGKIYEVIRQSQHCQTTQNTQEESTG